MVNGTSLHQQGHTFPMINQVFDRPILREINYYYLKLSFTILILQ